MNERVEIRVSPSLKRQILRRATEENRDVSGYVRNLVIEDVKLHPAPGSEKDKARNPNQ